MSAKGLIHEYQVELDDALGELRRAILGALADLTRAKGSLAKVGLLSSIFDLSDAISSAQGVFDSGVKVNICATHCETLISIIAALRTAESGQGPAAPAASPSSPA